MLKEFCNLKLTYYYSRNIYFLLFHVYYNIRKHYINFDNR